MAAGAILAWIVYDSVTKPLESSSSASPAKAKGPAGARPSSHPSNSHAMSRQKDPAKPRAAPVSTAKTPKTTPNLPPPAAPRPAAPGDSAGLKFRICAIIRGKGTEVSVGLVDKQTGRGELLKPGEATADGFRLVSADFKKETATFEKDGQVFLARLEGGVPIQRPATPEPPGSMPARPPPPVTSPALAETRPPAEETVEAFSNVVLQTESGDGIAMSPIANTTSLVQLETGGRTYALPRKVADTILNSPYLSRDQQFVALISFPALAEVQPGEDPATRARETEEAISSALTPPTNAPPAPPTELPPMMPPTNLPPALPPPGTP